MQFDWPTPDQMIYRLSRLRRLVLFAAALPICILLVGAMLDPTFISPDRATMAAAAIAILVMGHVVLFPNVPVETISLSLIVTAVSLAAPWVKSFSLMAPPEHVNAALILLVAFSMLAACGLMFVFQFVINAVMMAGPIVKLRVRAAIEVDCSPSVANRQFTLQPGVRRGRVLTGAADEDGFFDVAILAPQIADPEVPTQPLVIRVAAKTMETAPDQQQTMLVLPNGAVTVTAEKFTPTANGCKVELTELPGDFTLGMYAMFWLADQQMDNLTETADTIAGVPARANGLAHGVSFLSLARALLSPHQPVADRAD